MRLTEIETIPEDSTASIDAYEKAMAEAAILWRDPADNSVTIRQKDTYYGVFADDRLIAMMSVSPFYRDSSVWKINQTVVRKEFRQKGFMRLLVSWFRNSTGPLCSDEAQTEDAKAMWQALITQPGGLQIVAWNVDSGEKIPAKDISFDDIWNEEISPVLLIESFDLTTFSRSSVSVFEQADPFPHRRRWGLHLGQLWLNP